MFLFDCWPVVRPMPRTVWGCYNHHHQLFYRCHHLLFTAVSTHVPLVSPIDYYSSPLFLIVSFFSSTNFGWYQLFCKWYLLIHLIILSFVTPSSPHSVTQLQCVICIVLFYFTKIEYKYGCTVNKHLLCFDVISLLWIN